MNWGDLSGLSEAKNSRDTTEIDDGSKLRIGGQEFLVAGWQIFRIVVVRTSYGEGKVLIWCNTVEHIDILAIGDRRMSKGCHD